VDPPNDYAGRPDSAGVVTAAERSTGQMATAPTARGARLLRQAAALALGLICLGGAAVQISFVYLLHRYAPHSEVLGVIGLTPAILAFAACGSLLALRRPSNPVGWLLLLTGVSIGGVFSANVYANWALRNNAPLADFAAWVANWAFVPLVTCLILLLPLFFPDGRLPSRRWRWVMCVDLLYLLPLLPGTFAAHQPVSITGFGNVPNPYGLLPAAVATVGQSIAGIALIVGLIGSVASVIVRFRRAGGEERQQLKWCVLALVIIPIPFVAYNFDQNLGAPFFALFLPLVPVAITVSVLRFRLYEIDRIVSRTVSYAILTGFVVGVYAGIVTLVTRVLGFSSPVAVATSTLVAVALFNPLRVRIQRIVDRRFNRARYDAEATIAGFRARLRDAVDLETVRNDLLEVVNQAVEPTHASVWIRRRD